jgi:hypothetical protein
LHRRADRVMDGLPNARTPSASERTTDMADLRTCIGSAKFGIEVHEAPVGDFPAQPSQKDGLGRMCKPHWKAYVAGLTRDRKAKAQGGAEPTVQSQAAARVETKRAARVAAKTPKKPEPIRTRPARTSRAGGARTVLGGTLPEAIGETVAEAAEASIE